VHVKVTFILPAIGKKPGHRYIKTWQQMEPLTIARLKALTPSTVETEFFDDRIELIDYATETDLVAISAEFYTARRAYYIAGRFRERNVPTVIGGYHATLCPDEVGQHADAVVTGNAETAWEQVLADLGSGAMNKVYHGEPVYQDASVDRSIYGRKKYSALKTLEVGRGCIYRCEFCAISSFYGGKYHRKPIERVVKDIEHSGGKFFFFGDDNIVADQGYALELCKAIAPLGIRWSGQGSLSMAENPELLHWMKISGCEIILIGYESLNQDNLKQMNKGWIARLGDIDELTRRIHRAGLSIYATFVFGFDHDTEELVDRTLKFALKHRFFFAAFNHLLPIPGTPLHERLVSEGRLIDPEWWLSSSYRYGDVVIRTPMITPERLREKCIEARAGFYRLPAILRRSTALLTRRPHPFMYLYFWQINLNLQKEVTGKAGLPLGEGLDELPK
jgi:radical SAM superfamily enzyme YgiQ (UPF0313 family)